MKMTNSKSHVPVFDGRLFAWEGNLGTCEMSSIPDFRVSQVNKDSLDEGFYVKSHKTGTLKLFIFDRPRRIAGDVISLQFKSTDGITIEVFND